MEILPKACYTIHASITSISNDKRNEDGDFDITNSADLALYSKHASE